MNFLLNYLERVFYCNSDGRIFCFIKVDEYELEVAKCLTRRPWSYSCTGNDTLSYQYRWELLNAIFKWFKLSFLLRKRDSFQKNWKIFLAYKLFSLQIKYSLRWLKGKTEVLLERDILVLVPVLRKREVRICRCMK